MAQRTYQSPHLPHKAKGERHRLNVRSQVALVIALLSFLPNLMLVLILLLPAFREVSPLQASLWPSIALWMLVLALLSAAIGYLLSRQLLAPLTRLSVQIDALRRRERGARGKLPVDEDEPAETLALKQSFNDLLAQVGLEQSRRGSFMATLMHDLKTPLIAANNLLGVVRDSDTLSREERVHLVSQILQENRSLIALVQKMVDAHKFEREDVPLKKERCELGHLLAGVVERVRPLAEEKGIVMLVRGNATVTVDPRELERALYNLVSNAVRYARQQIKIDIYAGVIRLSDDGPGLPAPLEQLAQPFNAQPVDIAGKRYTAGTGGLGLFISRRIIEAHGGRLVSEMTSSKGTVLLIYLGQTA